MAEASVSRQLQAAELWTTRDGAAGPPGEPVFAAGWEDGHAFCAAVCSTDIGLAFCRACPTGVAGRVLETGRATSGRCPAGVRLLAFPAPRGSRTTAAVLRVAPPEPSVAARAAARTRVSAVALRRAARSADPPDPTATLAAARILRDPDLLLGWQVGEREHGADRLRGAGAALAQMIATSEEFHDLYRAAERQRGELERSRRRLDRLARETLRAKDEERARIAHQIHDTAAQSMVSAFRFLDAARASASHAGQPGSEHLDAAAERLVTAIGEVRAVLNELVPPGLEELGLTSAIRRRVEELTRDTGVRVTVGGDLPRLASWVEQALYGMTGEAVSNAVRHGRPRAVRVELGELRSRAVVIVADDGLGFDPAVVGRRRSSGGLGLLGLSRQASWLGGRASIQSRPGRGTRVRISLPLDRHRRPPTPEMPARDQPEGAS